MADANPKCTKLSVGTYASNIRNVDNGSKRLDLPIVADLNSEDVTFSVTAGASEEPRIPQLFPKAKLVTTTGQVTLGAEPVRAKRAHVWMSGDSDVLLFAKRNSTWAAVWSKPWR